MSRPGGWGRLALGAIAFALWAPLPLAALPLAALLIASGPQSARTRGLAAGIGGAGVLLLVTTSGGALGAAYAAWTVLCTGGFVAVVLSWRAPFWQQASRAVAAAGVALAGLATALWGAGWSGQLAWEVTRSAQSATRLLRWASPETHAALDGIAAFVGATFPAVLVLQGFAGLALGWQFHARLAERPLGGPLRPFREFRLGDVWVWGLVAAAAVWLLDLDVVAQNLAVVLGTLYLLQGAAVVVTFAATLGVSTAALIGWTALAAVLALPLLFIIPGLWTLGVTDTWLEYRRRLAARADSTGR